MKHPIFCDCPLCTIKGYEKLIKHHQQYIEEYRAKIGKIRKEIVPE